MNIWNKCRKTVYIILFAVLIPISAYIFYGALDTLKFADALSEILHGKMVPVFLLGTSFLLGVLLLGIFQKAVPYLERHWNRSVPVLFGVMIFLQVLMVLTVRTSLRYDHLKIFDTAAALMQNGTIAGTHYERYFMKFPINIPICLFTYFWLKPASLLGLPKEYWMDYMKLVNLLFMNLGLWCTFRLVCRYRSRKTGLYLLLLLLVNPLWYLLGQMYYTPTISLVFSMGSVWLFDAAGRQEVRWKKYVMYLLLGILLAAGYKIRATVIITMAAILIYAVLQVENLHILKKGMLNLAAVLAGMVLVFGVYEPVRSHYAGFDSSGVEYPMVYWLMTGAQGEGQYNSADAAYIDSFPTKEAQAEASVEVLKERIRQMGPGGVLTLFRNKLRVAFSDGTDDCYSLFQTMQETSGIQKYINGGRCDYLMVYLHGYHGMLTGLLLFAFVCRAFQRRRSLLDIFALNVCGAYLFYLIWEVDPAYSIPFMLMFLLWAADGMVALEDILARVSERYRPVHYLPAVAGAGTVLVFFCVGLAVGRAELPVREYSVLQNQESSDSLLLQTEFVQTFRTSKAFDHVDLWVANWDGPVNDSVYDLQILDEEGIVAEGEIIGSAAPCMEAYTIAFGRVVPEGEQTYRIQIRLRNPDCAILTDFLYYQSGAWDMYREGALFAPDEVPDVDLAFAVYEEAP